MTSRKAIRAAFAFLAIAFFATPIALAALGVTAEEFENRRLADAPKLSQGWNAFAQTTQYVTDRMPLRAQAVRANTRIWTDVFDADPRYARRDRPAGDPALPFAGSPTNGGADLRLDEASPLRGPATASTGQDGWLYVPIEFEIACDDSVSDAQVLERWSRLIQVLRQDGREAMLFVPPHKASVYPEHLPDRYPNDHCALAAKERLWRLLAAGGPERGIVELRSELLRLKANAGDGLFQRSDMHWTTLGAFTLIDAVLDNLGGGVRLEPGDIVARGSVPYTGDLSRVGGNAKTDTRDEYGIERRPDAPRVPGRTVLICDSFAYRWFRLFKPYFEDISYVSWYNPTQRVADAIRRADRVIVEADETLLKVQARDEGDALALIRELRRGR